MRILFLLLVLGMLCAAQELPTEEAQSDVAEAASSGTEASQSTSEWKLICLTIINTAKSSDTCPCQLCITKIQFDDTETTVTITIYDRCNGQYIEKIIKGVSEKEGVYIIDDDGVQEVRVIQLCDDVTVLLFVFVDEEGNQVILAAFSGNEACITLECLWTFLKQFQEVLETYGLALENTVALPCQDCGNC